MQNIGVIGVAVMGQNLIMNINDKGFSVSVFNRTTAKVDKFISSIKNEKRSILGFDDLKEFVNSLERPRKILLMIKAGSPVDATIQELIPLLSPGDIIIDGGNSFYKDTVRRFDELESKGLLYCGMGVSGGEEGARYGPCLMPGGSPKAWGEVKEIFQKVAAKTDKGEVCCEWMGKGGAGHYVKMVHNAIEYCDMQLICEAYDIFRHAYNLSPNEIADIFDEWNKTELESYLIEITRDILRYKDSDGEILLDKILDAAGQKGTGKWSCIDALERGVPTGLMVEAVFGRVISSYKEERVAASKILKGHVEKTQAKITKEKIEEIRQALLASKILAYTQGFMLFKTVSEEEKWDLPYGDIALIWREGCIIRSVFLEKIKQAYTKNPQLANLLLDDYFTDIFGKCEKGLRETIKDAISFGIPTPTFSVGLAFYDSYRTAVLPASLIQAQRDYFGAHTYERVDKKRGEFFHTNWTGKGGTTASTTYNV